ncbi:MAG: LptF/LptG family permease [Bacteroidetes bacterium]|nr:LptF/LptG family permease [Bacteroidota bacterium]
MLIIQKLYIKDFFRVFLILGLGISMVFSILGLIDKFDDFTSENLSIVMLFKYTLYNIPKYLNYVMPMAILLSGLFIFSQAMKRREIVAIKTAGGKMNRILAPFLVLGVLLSLFGFFLSEIVIPILSKEVQSIKNQLAKKESRIAFREGTIFMKGKDNSVVRIALYLEDKDVFYGVSIFKYDENGLKEKVDAETAEWDGNSWRLKNVTIFSLPEGKVVSTPEIVSEHMESPKILKKEMQKSEEMTITELIEYQKRLNDAGFKNIKLSVDISSRFSYPLINFFMVVLGLSLSTGADNRLLQKILHEKAGGKHMSGSGVVAVGLGLLISLLYWFGHSFFLSLGYAGTISSLVAAWIMPAVFAACSVYLYRQIPE